MTVKMLLVMDMLNDLVHENGGGVKTYVPLMKERNVLARTRAAIDRARAAGALIGYVRVGFSPDYRECPPNSPIFSRAKSAGMFKLGTWGTEVHPDALVIRSSARYLPAGLHGELLTCWMEISGLHSRKILECSNRPGGNIG
jgi:nicotinamidase-related amidase